MATIDELCGRGKLTPIAVNLSRREFAERRMFGTPEFHRWLNVDVKGAKSIDPHELPPRHQAYDFIRTFQLGSPFAIGRAFKRMRPHERDVFEFSTYDLRIFGWFYQRATFIAVCGDFMEHTHSEAGIYDKHRSFVEQLRAEIDLDPPKWIVGGKEDDVLNL
jgi:hypothetical protein